MANSKNRCTNCKKYFPAESMIVVVAGKFCVQGCLIEYGLKKTDAVIKKARANRKKETNRMRKNYYDNDRKHQLKLAKDACHAYIRYRDRDLPCIDCDKYNVAQWQAGHYKTRGGFPELQFNEMNIHKQCSQCNKDGLRGMVLYRINLKKKIGARNIEWLERSHPPQNLTLDDIKGITWWYKLKLKILQEADPDEVSQLFEERQPCQTTLTL